MPTPTSTRKPPAEPTALPTPIPTLYFHVYEIETGENSVETAFWSGDEKLIYAFQPRNTEEKTLTWVAYDPETRSSTTIASPLKYDPHIWGRLNVTKMLEEIYYPELHGYVSPSGKYVIYSVEYGDVSLGSKDRSARKEFWLADSHGRRKMKLLEGFLLGGIGDVQWRKSETKIIFDYGYEGGVRLWIADIQKGTVVPLADMSDFTGGTEETWDVSPDGTTLAVIDFDLNLHLVNLDTGKSKLVDTKVRYPTWSKDGKRLYYWWGPSFKQTDNLRVYDIISGNASTVLDGKSLAAAFGFPPGGYFAVSSNGDGIALWGGDLQLVELSR